MPRQALLRIHGHGQVEVELAAAYLTDLKHAYDSVLVFEAVMHDVQRAARASPLRWPPPEMIFGWPLMLRRATSSVRAWPATAKQIASMVPRAEQLVLSAVSVASPGVWEFLGTLNPLEVLRQYLNDRHTRRQDKDYRETAEKRRLLLENLLLENKVISERIKIAKDLGATDEELAPLVNALVYEPLMALDRYQDSMVIEDAEISYEVKREDLPDVPNLDE